MKKIGIMVLITALLVTGCGKKEEEVNLKTMKEAFETSKRFIDNSEYEKAKGILELIALNGYSNKIEGYSTLNGELDQMLLVKSYYENGKYQEAKVKLDKLHKEASQVGIVRGASEYKDKIQEKLSEGVVEKSETDTSTQNKEIKFKNVSASSYLKWKIDYRPERTIDNDFSSAWIEGVEGDGIGEYIELSSDKTVRIDTIELTNGLTKDYETYKRNNRITKVTLQFDNGKTIQANLKDENMEYQSINVGGIETKNIKIIIDEVETKDRIDRDTCISEIRIFGQEK